MNVTSVAERSLIRRSATLLTLALLGSALGCDTVAEISFDIRKFDRVRSPGLAHVDQCQDSATDSQLRFVMLDQTGLVIPPDAQLSEGSLNTSTFTASNVEVTEGRLYTVNPKGLVRCEVPDPDDEDVDPTAPNVACAAAGLEVCAPFDAGSDELGEFAPQGEVSFCRPACATNGDCESGTCVDGSYCALAEAPRFCDSDADCPSGTGFTCEELEGNASQKLCTQDTTVEVKSGSLSFISPRTNEERRAITLVMDNSGSLYGKGVVEDDSTVRAARATDLGNNRIAAAKLLTLSINSQPWRPSTVLSLWSFKGETSTGVRPLTGANGNPFVLNPSVLSNALDTLRDDSNFGRSNVFIALREVAENTVDLGINAQRRGTVILFTDGPDDSVVVPEDASAEQREAAVAQWEANLEDAIDRLKEADLEVIIIHLDTGIGAAGLLELKPDPLNAVPFPRDADGRFGPLDAYARIACETGGHYMYVTDPRALNERFDLVTDLLGGTWKVDVTVEALERAAVPAGPYRIGGVISVTADGKSDPFFMAPLGDEAAFGTVDKDDTRGVIFKRP